MYYVTNADRLLFLCDSFPKMCDLELFGSEPTKYIIILLVVNILSILYNTLL